MCLVPCNCVALFFLVVGSLFRLYYYLCVCFRWCVFSFSRV